MRSRRSGARLAAALAALALLAAAPAAGAQGARTPAERLGTRLDPATRTQVLTEVEAARRDGLPVEELVDRALEGASKHAPGGAIVSSVRDVRRALGRARTALGRGASDVEIEAGASALEAGVTPSVLASLRRARPQASLTVPLSVLTDLVGFGVPTDTAARTVLRLARAQDAALLEFQRDVERDIGVGALPAAAASLRAASAERSLLSTGANSPNLYSGDPGNASAPTNHRPPAKRKP
ncbi:MAG TPA: hypothetical protein VFS08_03845 [Gemmatimonadaceae bacterium]|nr:hypothetical protein [Gemmatimonadaceae bacterium]